MALPPETAALLDRLARFGTRLGLERIRALLAALGDPQEGLPAVLVAGTNGKGTVAALLASFGVAGRYRTGLYTSPHLETPEERLRLDGAAIDAERLAGVLNRVVEAAEEHLDEPPTYFEVLTAAAVLWFAEEKVELAILEVGLGGRFDATNALEPRVAVITSVGLDHREHLGDTLEEVTREKAGILRTGVPVITAGGPPEVTRTLEAEASRVGAERLEADRRFRIEAVQRFRPFGPDALRQRVWLRRPGPGEAEDPAGRKGPAGRGSESGDRELEVFELTLAGRHQAENLAVALTAAEELRRLGWERLTGRRLGRGARACRWPGRLEEVTIPDAPGGGEARVLLDVAHNPAGAAALAAALDDLGEPVDLLFGVLQDKDAGAMLEHLAPRATALTLTRPSEPRGREAASLAELVPAPEEPTGKRKRRGGDRVRVAEPPDEALAQALRRAEGRVLVACGSLALVGEIRTALRQRYGVPEPAAAIRIGP